MAEFKDLTGQRFGRLIVAGISRKVQSGKRERYYWECSCDCGKTKNIRTDCLTSGLVRSCGCLKKEQDAVNLTKNHRHKLSNTRIWHVYYSMLHRCYNENDSRYSDYGGRGISVCEEWKNSFDAFAKWAIENGYTEGLQIDRINNNGNYEPENCRWVDIKTNCRNRRSNVIVSYKGKEMTLVEASEKSGLSYSTLRSRWERGIRGEALFNELAPKGNKRETWYNGKLVTLKELSKITGINLNTLNSRYYKGKRGDDLVK